MFAHISVDNSYSSFISTTLALCIISLILALALRSVKMGLVSFIINILPAALAFGVWCLGAIGGPGRYFNFNIGRYDAGYCCRQYSALLE